MLDRSDILARSHLLLGPAEAALRARLASAPEDLAALWRLAGVLRQRGDLAGAAEAARAVLAAEPAHADAARLLALLDGRPVALADGIQPSPFALAESFLDVAEQATLWAEIEAHAASFADAKVGTAKDQGAQVRTDRREAKVLLEDAFPATAERFRTRLPALARSAWVARGLAPVDVSRVEFLLSVHLDGGFFKVHQDHSREGKPSTRLVTFVYYLHRHPKRFAGGDLLLLDTDLARGRFGSEYTRITPDDGRLVLFPSPYYHQVTPVTSEADDLMDGRFAVTGWLHGPASDA